MRVITGLARGRKLESPLGDDVRPTTDSVKESVFSIIQFYVEGGIFLDAFAGTGQMGIEALSRGLCGLSEGAVTLTTDSISFMERTDERFDIVFLDPPYMTGLLEKALETSVVITKPSGIIICEHPKEEKLPEKVGEFSLKKSYRYGKIMLSVYTVPDRD